MSRTKLAGILNVTPDSFSDGGAHYDPQVALQAVERLLADGADIIDIGAESTRPGAQAVSPDEEWRRLEPVLVALPDGTPFGVDTRHAETARQAVEMKARWINDVSGFADKAMMEVVRDAECRLVVMHSLSVPADKTVMMPESCDVVAELLAFAYARIAALQQQGIARERVIFDPGIGFGKNAAQSLAILRRIDAFRMLDVPVLVGHSRKSFLASFGERDDATLAVSQCLAQRGVDFLRVHDVARHRRMLKVTEALHG